jgi:hypothetical protein
MPDAALFRRRGGATYEPTSAAVGAWDASIVHGAAVSALFAGRLAPADGTLARLTVEFHAPVPLAPLDLALDDPAGGKRVQRRHAALSCDGRTVATAQAVVVRTGELVLPPAALDHASPFDPATAPPLDRPNLRAERTIGWESFDSRSAVVEFLRVEGDPRVHQWISLVVPVVDGVELQGVEVAAIAADYSQSAVYRQLPFGEWSYRNAELTVHLARHPVGTWVGSRCEAVVSHAGAGFNAADLFDAEGRVGRAAAALVVERRA